MENIYQTPQIEVLEINVEQGFASSNPANGGAGGSGWSEWGNN